MEGTKTLGWASAEPVALREPSQDTDGEEEEMELGLLAVDGKEPPGHDEQEKVLKRGKKNNPFLCLRRRGSS